MSMKISSRGNGASLFVVTAAISLMGCGQPLPGAGSNGPAASSAAAPGTAAPVSASPKAVDRPKMALLEEGERRVPLFVVPGDALVEVDGQPAYRRDGVIDLTGKVGDVRHVRVWKGNLTTEKDVKIQDPQLAPPTTVNLNEAAPRKAVAKQDETMKIITTID
jgi:hypothetical protein